MKTACIIIYHLGIGGAEQVVVAEIRELLRRGFRVRLVTLCPERANTLMGSVPAECEKECIQFRSLYDWKALRALMQSLKHANPDIILSHLWFANTVSRIAARGTGLHKRLLIFEQNNYDQVKSWKQFLLDRLLQRWCAKIIAVSDGVRRSLIRHGIDARRVVTIYNAIDVARVANAEPSHIRKELGIGNEVLYLFVGRLVRQKGVDVLLNAFARVDSGVLLLAGEGADRAEFESQVKKLGIKSRVFFLGVRHDVPSLMKSADCFVLASRWEGLAVVLVEALAAEIPIVATSIDGIKDEIIDDGKNGILVPPDDPTALAAVLQHIGENRELRKTLIKDVRSRVNLFSITRHVEQLLGSIT